MDGWVERWKALRWGEILKDEWIPSSSLSALLHFLSFPQLSLSFLWVSVSLCHCFSLCYGLSPLPSSLSLSYSDQMSNSCDAVAWLINALKEPREVEHNKQTGEGGKKRKRKDLREKPEEELVRMNMCVSMEILMLPFRLLHQVVWLSEGPFFFLISLSLFLSLEKSCSVVLWGNELIINRKWKSKNTHTQVRQS